MSSLTQSAYQAMTFERCKDGIEIDVLKSDARDAINAIIAADRALRHKAADGFVLVPREPTHDMCAAGFDSTGGHIGMALSERLYKAMIAAAPKEPK